MEIIFPAHNKPATPVENWKEIKKDALELQEFIKSGQFKGYYGTAYAISHTQVSEEPKRFFVINKDKKYKLKKIFGSWCVVNLKIIKGEDLVEFTEACMSWPFRQPRKTERYFRVKVKYQIPFLGLLIPKTKKFKGLPAFICAHEADHAEGRNIYGK